MSAQRIRNRNAWKECRSTLPSLPFGVTPTPLSDSKPSRRKRDRRRGDAAWRVFVNKPTPPLTVETVQAADASAHLETT